MTATEQVPTLRVGRYQLVDRLAVGGMAEVFLAVDRSSGTDRLVVIKRILPHLAQSPEFMEGFAHEARIAALIHHPNVIRLYELGQASGLPYIAMEYLPGSTVKDLLVAARAAGRALPIDVALDLLVQACAGAHAAHELVDPTGRPFGLVHRDITPHNLMVGDEGHVKLLDFGIAKASEGMDHTRTGLLKGKIAYMSPEQCRQERLDRRSDVFSLGVVGYQLLTGKKPFQGTSELATMQAIISCRYVPLASVRLEVPEAVATAIQRAMAPTADERFPDAESFREALRDAGGAVGSTTGEFVRSLLGPVHDARRAAISSALSHTLDPVFSASQQEFAEIRLNTESLDALAPVLSPPTLPSAPSRRRTGAVVVALAGIVGIGVAFSAVAATVAWVGVRTALDSGPPIGVSIAPTLGPVELATELEPIRLYLEDKLGRRVTLQMAGNYHDAAQAVIDGVTAYGILPPNTVASARLEARELDVLAVKVVDGSTSTDGYLIVRREEHAKDVQDLVGRTVCWTEELSSTGYVLPRAYIRSHGLDPDLDFVAHWSGNHEQVLRDLLDGTCDLGATFSVNYQTADQREIPTAQLRILGITGSSPHDAVVAGPAADPEVTRALRAALLEFDPLRDVGTPRVGRSERITGFVVPPPDFLDDP